MKTTFGLAEVILAIILALVVHSLVQLDAGLGAILERDSATQPQPCDRSLELWFYGTGLLIASFAVAFSAGRGAEDGASWWFISPQSRVAKAAFAYSWAVFLPCLAAWTVLGMNWLSETLRESPDCFSDHLVWNPTACALSQILCGVAVVAYSVLVACVWDARRCRQANGDAIESVQDADLVQRWGALKPSATMELCGGLTPEEFGLLPRHRHSCDDGQCVVCLSAMTEDEHVRSLPGCGHVFHRACIDLWLLRKTSCPLCKTDVRSCQDTRQHDITEVSRAVR